MRNILLGIGVLFIIAGGFIFAIAFQSYFNPMVKEYSQTAQIPPLTNLEIGVVATGLKIDFHYTCNRGISIYLVDYSNHIYRRDDGVISLSYSYTPYTKMKIILQNYNFVPVTVTVKQVVHFKSELNMQQVLVGAILMLTGIVFSKLAYS